MRSYGRRVRFISSLLLTLIFCTMLWSTTVQAKSSVVLGENPAKDDISESCETLIILDADTNEIMFSKNADVQYTLSGKPVLWMLALSSLDYLGLSDTVDVEIKDFGLPDNSKVLGISRGNTFTVRDLIAATVLEGDMDAAVLLRNAAADKAAEIGALKTEAVVANSSGRTKSTLDYKSFVLLMNEKAVALGMKHTFYANALGFADETQITTANDQLALMNAIIADKALFRVMRMEQYSFEISNRKIPASIRNTELNMDTKSVYYDKRVKAAAGGNDNNGVAEIVFGQSDIRSIIGVIWCSNATENEGATFIKDMLDQYASIEDIDIYNEIAQKVRSLSYMYEDNKITNWAVETEEFVCKAYKGFKLDDKELTFEIDESTVYTTESGDVEIMVKVIYEEEYIGDVQLTTNHKTRSPRATPVPVFTTVEMERPSLLQEYGWIICIGGAAILGLLVYLLGRVLRDNMQ